MFLAKVFGALKGYFDMDKKKEEIYENQSWVGRVGIKKVILYFKITKYY